MERKEILRIGVGFAIGIALLALLTQAVGWERVLSALRIADPFLFFTALIVALSALVAWSMVLNNVMRMAEISVPTLEIIPIYFSARFANYVTPLGQAGGEPIAAYVLHRHSGVPFEEGLASIVTTDLLNLIPFFALSVLGIGGFLVFFELTPLIRATLLFLLLMGVLVAIFVAFFWYERRTAERLLLVFVRPIRKVLKLLRSDWGAKLTDDYVTGKVENFYRTLETIVSNRGLFVQTLAFSTLGWILFILPIYFLSLSLGTPVPLLVLLFIVPMSTIAGFTPLPGGLAAVEFALAQLLVVFGPLAGAMNLSWAAALAITLLYRLVIYWIPLGIGGLITVILTVAGGVEEVPDDPAAASEESP